MTSTTREWTNTFRVGTRWKCEMTYRGNGVTTARWSPDVPRRLTSKELKDYKAGRHALMIEISKAIGGSVLVIE